MKALTIQQPWATLIARGRKSIETRSWPAPSPLIGERMAIHAGAKAADLNAAWPAWQAVAISHDGIVATRWPARDRGAIDALPLGAVVATARLADCVPMVEFCDDYTGPAIWCDDERWWYDPDGCDGQAQRMVDVTEQVPLGHFEVGRYGWIFDEVEQLEPPQPYRGAQRLWEWPR